MAALGSQSIASSYEQLLHVDADGGGNSTTHVSVKDGDNGTTFGFTIASDALMMSSTNRLEFGDTGTYIHQSADGVLDLVSDTELELNATTIDINGALDLDGTFTQDAGAVVFNEAGADHDFRIESSGNTNMLFVDGGSDAVGIGTSTVGTSSHNFSGEHNLTLGGVVEDSFSVLEIAGNETDPNAYIGVIEFVNKNNSDAAPGTAEGIAAISTIVATDDDNAGDDSGGNLQFWTKTLTGNLGERMRIDHAGLVGIGIAPSYKLEVAGDVSGNFIARFFNDGDDFGRHGIRIDGGADDGSGTTSYVNCRDGNGDQVGYLNNTSGTFAVTDVSDRRLKDNIRDTEINGLDTIALMQVRDFEWKKSGDTCVGGFVAQELKPVFPSAVSGEDGEMEEYEISPAISAVEAREAVLDEDGNIVEEAVEAREAAEAVMGERISPMGVARDTIVPVLVKAIQELSAKVEALEG